MSCPKALSTVGYDPVLWSTQGWQGMGEVHDLGIVGIFSLKEEIGRVLKLEMKEVTRMTTIL